jgi:hypothetical protein
VERSTPSPKVRGNPTVTDNTAHMVSHGLSRGPERAYLAYAVCLSSLALAQVALTVATCLISFFKFAHYSDKYGMIIRTITRAGPDLLQFLIMVHPPPTNQHGSHRQCRRNDATELARADMTTLPKVDTSCTTLSLMPTVIDKTFAASLRTDISPQRKEARTHVSRSIRLIFTF